MLTKKLTVAGWTFDTLSFACEVLTRNIVFSRKILIHYAILIVTVKD